jgi:2,3-bisphosphoglycerate-independent phosphoglycerate mutase
MQAALIVLDGWGINDGPGESRDAVAAAATPTVDALLERGASGRLDVSGRRVGLPDGQMGNSEVGHLNLGAGRVVTQAYTRIDDAVAAGDLADNDALDRAFSAAAEGGRVHFLGLVGDGGVHASQTHLHALIDRAADRDVEAVTHAFTDGRDTDPTDGRDFLADLAAHAAAAGTGEVATVTGRYHAMDRDRNWERTRRAYDALVDREAPHTAPDPVVAVEASYDRGDTDEFVDPTLIEGGAPIRDGDAVVFYNFRADRARQLTRMLADLPPGARSGTDAAGDRPAAWPADPPDVELVTMTEYDDDFPFPVAFPPAEPTGTLGDRVAETGGTQLRIAESEKYPHVTYFLNGGRETAVDGERRRIVESPDVPTYDEAPAMSAREVTDAALAEIDDRDPDLLVANYANPDMVGHTGDYAAAVTAVETVDREAARLVDVCLAAGAHVVVTADHGNADDMGTPEDPHTAHTRNEVPVAYLAPDGADAGLAPDATGDPERDLSGGWSLRSGGSLCDVAPTLLTAAGIGTSEAMTGESLLR